MPTTPTTSTLITAAAAERDGTSQLGRALSALSPEYVSVDERTTEDLLSFVRAHAGTLVHHDELDRPAGDLGAFFGALTPAEIAAFLREPSRFDPSRSPALFRPHFTLFLTFLRLFQGAQADLNAFTRRHLDFHYRRFLRMLPRAAVPDRVSLLFALADHETHVLVPAGTEAHAGADSLGRERIYRTEKDLIVHRARVERLSSVFVERRLISVARSWHDHKNRSLEGRFEMMRIALGRPLPGDPLPDYPDGTKLDTPKDLDDKLRELQALVQLPESALGKSLAELRALMELTVPFPTSAADREAFEDIIDGLGLQRNAGYQPLAAKTLSFDDYATKALGPLSVPGRPELTKLSDYWAALLQIEKDLGIPLEDAVALVESPLWIKEEEEKLVTTLPASSKALADLAAAFGVTPAQLTTLVGSVAWSRPLSERTKLKDTVQYSKQTFALPLAKLRSLMALNVAPVVRRRYERGIDAVGRAWKGVSYVSPSLPLPSFDDYVANALGPLSVPGRPELTKLSTYWDALLQIEKDLGIRLEDAVPLVESSLWIAPDAELAALKQLVTTPPASSKALADLATTPPASSKALADLAAPLGVTPAQLKTLVGSVAWSRPLSQRTVLKDTVQYAEKTLTLTLPELRTLRSLMDLTGDGVRLRYERGIDAIGTFIAESKGATYTRPAAAGLSFDGYASAALGVLPAPASKELRAYYSDLQAIEAYFGMSFETFAALAGQILRDGNEWDKAYETEVEAVARTLERAHHEKLRVERTGQLKAVRAGQTLEMQYPAMLQHALTGKVDKDKGAAFIGELEDSLRAYLTETDVKALQQAAAAGDWDSATGLLAHAMGLRLGKRPPQKVVWIDLFPSEDARAVTSPRGVPDAEGKPPFSTFGAPAADLEAAPAPSIGLAITSPVLSLAAGTRTIALTLGLRSGELEFEYNALKKAFTEGYGKVDALLPRNLSPIAVEVSTAKGWYRLEQNPSDFEFDGYTSLIGGAASGWQASAGAQGLRLTFTLGEDAPAIAPLPSPPGGMDGRFPALRVVMMPVWSAAEDRYITFYRELMSLRAGAVHLKVTAAGLAPSALDNDEAVLDPGKPFEPFGVAPSVSSRLSIGHPEIAGKKIERLKLTYKWMGGPPDVKDHYANYPITASNATPAFTGFSARLRWMDVSGPETIVDTHELFADRPGTTLADATLEASIAQIITVPRPADHAPPSKGTVPARPSTWRRCLQWELLSPDFQHKAYPVVAAQKSLELSLKLADTTVAKSSLSVAAYQVKPPYTPKLEYLKLEYDSSVEILFHSAKSGDRVDRVYHIHPFGAAELALETSSDTSPVLPCYDADSELCVGLSGVSLPETVTLLFQLDEGSADRDVAPPPITWSQLSGNRWIPLGHNVLSDGTRGLQTSGVVELSLRRAEPSTLLSPGLTWIRASASRDHASLCDTRAVCAQAVTAVFEDRGNAPDHFRAPLPGGAIARLVSPVPGIAGVAQPYPSYGGRPAEDERTFATRVSERLRHKDRALSPWDYERIVLDAFPQIFKAKCIPAAEGETGLVRVLVIPDVRSVPTNELGPKAPIALLSAIQEHLAARSPAPVHVDVRNATFRAVRLRLGVRFRETGNDAYWTGRLNDELNRYLSPWAYDEGADIVIGGKIHASNVVDFVDRRSYVDYVAGISLFYTDDEGQRFTFLLPPGDGGGEYCVNAGGADHVLVAYPKHRIDVLATERYDARLYRGISYMELEMDNVVG